MSEFHITDKARSDMDTIWLYIAQDNMDAADQVENDIIKAMYNLSNYPLIGHRREDLTMRDIRFWNVHSYLIVYDANTQPISIARVLSGYRDISSAL